MEQFHRNTEHLTVNASQNMHVFYRDRPLVAIIRRHYWDSMVSRTTADQFWALTPESVLGTVRTNKN